MMDEIKMLGIYFNCYRKLNQNESRELIVNASKIFLKEINSSEEIRPYLKKYP